ncbi:hypothetical protein BACCAP_01284 [Pseudoflavonifractor capillosus ATCC 29799]|uniref:Uncharacterized protein n=1 Tax=Pseudoflavonifractor capillosus ATCC 29799 TaxID=411467 RepID=A6NSV5_9FIRM|nr:hypothetical protein BACCAP_01284 [Pseudoflavonifractor capillosus ATCC 29799]
MQGEGGKRRCRSSLAQNKMQITIAPLFLPGFGIKYLPNSMDEK